MWRPFISINTKQFDNGPTSDNEQSFSNLLEVETCIMEKELGPEIIKATQASLGKHVKRPPLTDKLLKKPPFRFLHDIITSVLKTNGFFEGLFEDDELISDNVKDRDSKILFLNKAISVVALVTGKSLSIKPSKIVAGQEPEKTNELLQNIAYALDKKLSSDEAVKKFKETSKAPQPVEDKTKDSKAVKKNSDAKKFTSRSSEKLVSNKKESTSVNKNEKSKTSDPKSKRKETNLAKNEPQVKKSQNLRAVGKKASVESIKQPSSLTETSKPANQEQNPVVPDVAQKEIEVQDAVDTTGIKSQEDPVEIESSRDHNGLRSDQDNQGNLNNSYTIPDVDHNSSLSSQDLMEGDDGKTSHVKSQDSPVVKSNENSSKDRETEPNKESVVNAEESFKEDVSLKKPRPALIPKHNSLDSEIKTKELTRNNSQDNPTYRQGSEIVRPASVRPSSSRPGAPRLREKIDIVIPDSDNLLMGKVNIIAENSQNDEEEENSVIIVEQHELGNGTTEKLQEAIHLSSNEHGHLVQQILNSQKELSQNSGKTEIEWQFGTQKAKEASSQEMEQLRFNIQALSRVANPLGKLLDHIQEDVEVMRQELQQWTKVYDEVSKDMLQQKAESEKTLLPLQTRVKQLDVDIEEKRDKINDIKILIHKNTGRIEKLLANGNVQ